jgi:hypothetical protein
MITILLARASHLRASAAFANVVDAALDRRFGGAGRIIRTQPAPSKYGSRLHPAVRALGTRGGSVLPAPLFT